MVVLKDKGSLRILNLHLLHQMLEVVAIGLMGLATIIKELNLLAAHPAYANRAGQVSTQELLVPL